MDVLICSSFQPEFDGMIEAVVAAARECRLEARRCDDTPFAVAIAQEIERDIRESLVVVADITGSNANVLIEIGRAQSLGKRLILISQDPPESAPFDIRGLRIYRYSKDDLAALRAFLTGALSQVSPPNEPLRAMLVPESLGTPTGNSRFVIAASPLSWRRLAGRSGGYDVLRRTYSDYVGVRGILQSFGNLYGFEALPDITDPGDYTDRVVEEKMTLYSIASPKANSWTGRLLQEFGARWVPRLEFRADPASPDLRNIRASLFADDVPLVPHGWRQNEHGDRYRKDFGLIVRGENPFHPDRMFAVLAGRSSLGTEAACTAFTDTRRIMEIRQRLTGFGVNLEDHRQGFWALVSMERASGGAEESVVDTLKLEKVDVFSRQR